MESTAYVYRMDQETGQWSFQPVEGIDLKGESFIKKRIETWTLETGLKADVYGYIFSRAEMDKRFQLKSIEHERYKLPLSLIPVIEPITPIFSIIREDGSSICDVTHYMDDDELKHTVYNHDIFFTTLRIVWDWRDLRAYIEGVASISIIEIENWPDKYLFIDDVNRFW